MKVCARCREELPESEFTAAPRMKSGLKSYCRDCCRLDARERRAANPERARAIANASHKRRYTTEWRWAQGLRRYGLTAETFATMLVDQGGRCAICRTDAPLGKSNRWHVDHCHATGVVRGLLCAGCNVGIGHLGDDPDRLRSAAAYIEHHREQENAA